MNTLHRKMIEEICQYFGCNFQEVFSRRRQKNLIYAKKVIYWILRREGLSYNQIARLVNKDHETIIIGIRTMPQEFKRYAFYIFNKYRKWGLKEQQITDENIFNEKITKIVDMLNNGMREKEIAKALNETENYIINRIALYIELKKIPDYKEGIYKYKYFFQKNKKNY